MRTGDTRLSLGAPGRAHVRYLADAERAVLEVRRHVAVLLRPFFATVGVVVAGSVIGALASPDAGSDALDTLVGVIALACVVRFAWVVLVWWMDRLVVTDHRIFEISGVLSRRVASMPLTKVTDMTYRRTVGGRIFGYGDLMVETAGQRQALDRIQYLPDPDLFYRTVTSLVATRSRVQDVAPRAPAVDAPARRAEGPEDTDTGPLPPTALEP
jgi:uncharacterized membrane protein YdbT with pleckstrin-like domain